MKPISLEQMKGWSAVLLIISSIALAFYQTIVEHDVANGVLMYIAQAFLLAGSLFGIDYYMHKLKIHGNEIDTTRNPQQQSTEHHP